MNGDAACPMPQHRYGGECPDEHQPDARDPDCPVCRALLGVGE